MIVTSRRETSLWLAMVLAIVAIFATLGLARTWADELRSREMIDTAFVWAVVAMAVATALLAWRIRPGGLEIGVGLAVAAVYVLVAVRMVLPEERTHLAEYGVVALLMYEALLERRQNGRPLPAPATLAIVATSLIGAADEAVQLAIPSRVFDLADIFTNTVAAALGVSARRLLALARRARTG